VRALSALCSRFDGQGGVRIERQLTWGIPPLTDEVELVVYRVAQEALTNVLRHAAATRAIVSLETQPAAVVLSVRDDGRGLGAAEPHGGLEGMRERAMLIGAEFGVRAGVPSGTEVVLRVPVDT
jgi:two-component system sensor histidine kinase UhpB